MLRECGEAAAAEVRKGSDSRSLRMSGARQQQQKCVRERSETIAAAEVIDRRRVRQRRQQRLVRVREG